MMSGDYDYDDDEEEELSSGSGSGDEVHVINGHNKRVPTAPSAPPRKRNRKAGGDAIVEAMLAIAAASKMRAAALTNKNRDNSQGV